MKRKHAGAKGGEILKQLPFHDTRESWSRSVSASNVSFSGIRHLTSKIQRWRDKLVGFMTDAAEMRMENSLSALAATGIFRKDVSLKACQDTKGQMNLLWDSSQGPQAASCHRHKIQDTKVCTMFSSTPLSSLPPSALGAALS